MFLPRLVLANMASHKVRLGLTVAAMALAVSLVIAITSGTGMIETALNRYFVRLMGSDDARVVPGPNRDFMDDSIVAPLQRDPAVLRAVGRLEVRRYIATDRDAVVLDSESQVIGVTRPDDKDVEALRSEAGTWFASADGDVAVVDQEIADKMKLRVGDWFVLQDPDEPAGGGQGVGEKLMMAFLRPHRALRLQVVGIVHMPEILVQQVQTLYVPLHTLQRFLKREGQLSQVLVQLRRGADTPAFAKRWTEDIERAYPALELRIGRDSRQRAGAVLQSLRMVSYLGAMISLLAATFIVFSTLSMGVSERLRVLGMLRSVGATRGQVARLVVLEGVLVAVPSAAFGVALGWVWVQLLGWRFGEFLGVQGVINRDGLLLGVIGSIVAAMLASLLPAAAAARVSVLEALSPLAARGAGKMPWLSVVAGAVLVCVDPLVIYASGWPPEAKFLAHFILGLPTMMLGFFLLAPLVVWLADRLGGGLVARVLGLRPALVRQQLTGGIWRAAGTGAALMVGLAVLVVMQTHGQSVLRSWRLPERFPDFFIFSRSPLSKADEVKLASLPEVAHETVGGKDRAAVLPIAVAMVSLNEPPSAFGIEDIVRPHTTMFLGVDPEMALQMLELDFREGNMADAMAALKKGKHLIVTDEFRQLKGLHVGDTIALRTKDNKSEQWTICGVVFSPGIDVIVNVFNMHRAFQQHSAASVFGNINEVAKDFGVDLVSLYAINLKPAAKAADMKRHFMQAVREGGFIGGDARAIKDMIQKIFLHILNLLSTVAFAAMLVACVGVTNTIVASVRSRRWTLGVLRSVGLTRGQLARLILAEVLLVGIVGVTLGLAAGAELTASAAGMTRYMVGYIAPLYVPWAVIFTGVGIVMGLTVLAGLWPVISTGRAQPLDLLQGGRAAG